MMNMDGTINGAYLNVFPVNGTAIRHQFAASSVMTAKHNVAANRRSIGVGSGKFSFIAAVDAAQHGTISGSANMRLPGTALASRRTKSSGGDIVRTLDSCAGTRWAQWSSAGRASLLTNKATTTRRAGLDTSGSLICKGRILGTRRTTLAPDGRISLVGAAASNRRSSAIGADQISFRSDVSANALRQFIGNDTLRLDGGMIPTRRQTAKGTDDIRLLAVVATNARRGFSALGRIALQADGKFTRRQEMVGSGTVIFRAVSNASSIARLHAKGKVSFIQAGIAIRRATASVREQLKMMEKLRASVRFRIIETGRISLSGSIKLPHVHMLPVEEIRQMHLQHELRTVAVFPEPAAMLVSPDNREIMVPQRRRSIGTPDTEDTA